MLDRSTFSRCAELGLPTGMPSYVQGRLGVMGDVSADEAADAAFFFDRGMITAGWEADCDLTRSEGGAAYALVCADLGRTYLEGFDGAERMPPCWMPPTCPAWRWRRDGATPPAHQMQRVGPTCSPRPPVNSASAVTS